MKEYTVEFQGREHKTRAASAHTAIANVVRAVPDRLIIGRPVTIKRVTRLSKQYFVTADVPCDPPGSHKKENVAGPFTDKELAWLQSVQIEREHPDYRFVHTTWRYTP